MRFIAAAIVALALTMAPVFPPAADGGTQVMKAAVYADGRIVADGHEIALPALRQAFAQLSKAHGKVLYYRDAGIRATSERDGSDTGNYRSPASRFTLVEAELFELRAS